jgi:hypothetical protein
VNFGAQELRKGISRLQGIFENATMLCHAMHPMQDYFWEDFYMHDKFDIQPICTSILVKFYVAKSGCYKPTPLEGSCPRDSGSTRE